jgi:uncharacterized protein
MKILALASFLPLLLAAQEPSSRAPNPAAGVAASTVDPAFAADIRRLFDDAGLSDLIKQQMDLMAPSLMALAKQNPQVTQPFLDELMRRMKENLSLPHIEQMAVEIYAKYFTRDDIRQMIAYQESPVGRKARQVTPKLLAEFTTAMRDYGQKIGAETGMEVAKEHPEWIKKPTQQ